MQHKRGGQVSLQDPMVGPQRAVRAERGGAEELSCKVADVSFSAFSGLPFRRLSNKMVSFPPPPPLAKQLHQSHRYVGGRLHPGRDADGKDALRW